MLPDTDNRILKGRTKYALHRAGFRQSRIRPQDHVEHGFRARLDWDIRVRKDEHHVPWGNPRPRPHKRPNRGQVKRTSIRRCFCLRYLQRQRRGRVRLIRHGRPCEVRGRPAVFAEVEAPTCAARRGAGRSDDISEWSAGFIGEAFEVATVVNTGTMTVVVEVNRPVVGACLLLRECVQPLLLAVNAPEPTSHTGRTRIRLPVTSRIMPRTRQGCPHARRDRPARVDAPDDAYDLGREFGHGGGPKAFRRGVAALGWRQIDLQIQLVAQLPQEHAVAFGVA